VKLKNRNYFYITQPIFRMGQNCGQRPRIWVVADDRKQLSYI